MLFKKFIIAITCFITCSSSVLQGPIIQEPDYRFYSWREKEYSYSIITNYTYTSPTYLSWTIEGFMRDGVKHTFVFVAELGVPPYTIEHQVRESLVKSIHICMDSIQLDNKFRTWLIDYRDKATWFLTPGTIGYFFPIVPCGQCQLISYTVN